MMTDLQWMYLSRIAEVLVGSGLLMLLWKANRVLNRVWDMLREYPPHRHVGSLIQYPTGYAPGKTEELNVGKGARA